MRKEIHRVLTGMKGHYLNPKQERFVQEYCISLNASDAARKAGYSQHSAGRFCLELLTKPHIQDAIQRKRKDIAIQTNISALRVVQETVSVALSNIKHLIEQDPKTKEIRFKDLNKVPEHILASVASIEQIEEGGLRTKKRKVKITLWPKVPALEALTKMLGYSSQTVESELAQQQPENKQANLLDPKTFTNEEFEVFRKINERRLDALKP